MYFVCHGVKHGSCVQCGEKDCSRLAEPLSLRGQNGQIGTDPLSAVLLPHRPVVAGRSGTWCGNIMSDKFKRRRRTGSTSARFRPSQLVPVESVRPSRMGKAELAAAGAVSISALALIVLIWIVTGRAMQDQNAEIRDRAEQALIGQASTMAETIGHELSMIDQSLTIIQAAWKADSDTVDLAKWQKQFPALLSVADDVFIADERQIIRQDILPNAIGQGVGAAYVSFPHGSLEQYQTDGTKAADTLLLQGGAGGAPIDARQFLLYVVRPLDHPRSWLIGASYRSSELTKLFADASLGHNALAALVDTKRGIVQAVVGPAARRPNTDLSRSTLFGLIARSDAGTWLGASDLDGVERLHAFHRVGHRDMAVIVAANWTDVMAPAASLAAGAHSLALIASALVVVIGGIVMGQLYAIRSNAREKRIAERNKKELDRMRGEEAALTARAALYGARLQAVLGGTTDGLALFDSGLRLVQWNHPFVRGMGIELNQDMPLDSMLRRQTAPGQFESTEQLEAEIARRSGILRSGDTAGIDQPGPDGETLILRGLPIAEGGFMLILNGLARWGSAPLTGTDIDADVPAPAPAEPAVAPPEPIDW